MSYIGNTPTNQNFVAGADQFSGTGSQTVFTLSRNVNTVFDIFVTVSNVPQDPFTAYTVAGNTLTFDSAPPSGTNNIDVVYRATNVQTFLASPRSVGLTQLSATGTPSASTFLRGDNTWAVASSLYAVEYLIIGGGGSGGVYNPTTVYVSGNPGTSSSFAGITAIGGGAGVAYSGSTANRNGGSGGGGGSSGGDNNNGGTGTSGQGFAGGTGQFVSGVYQGGGGGGAGAVGGNASGTTAGSGGNGITSSITGSAVARAGGGGGCAAGAGSVRGLGGSGGGGNGVGATPGYGSGGAGTVNTGSGGGAGDNGGGAGHGGGGAGGYRCSVAGELSGANSSAEAPLVFNTGSAYSVVVGAGGAAVGGGGSATSGAGSSGVVIIRYLGAQRGTGGTVTSAGGYTIHTFTTSGTFTA